MTCVSEDPGVPTSEDRTWWIITSSSSSGSCSGSVVPLSDGGEMGETHCKTDNDHCAGKRKGCHPPPPKKAPPETQLYVLWVFSTKTQISKGYKVAPFHPIHLKFGMHTRLGVFYFGLKFQVFISSRTEVTDWSHLLKIQCNRHAHRGARA